jgi:hypothetical protein
MPMWKTALAAIAAASLIAVAADGQRRRDQDQDRALAALRQGHALSLREIEGRIVPRMAGADYLGPEFDPGTSTYRLKFMRDGSVIWIDVDPRTGQIVGRSGY